MDPKVAYRPDFPEAVQTCQILSLPASLVSPNVCSTPFGAGNERTASHQLHTP
jgi:hypothetical protein